MRVLHVINQLGRAGAELSLQEFVTATQGRGLEHGVAVLRPGLAQFGDLPGLGVSAYAPEAGLSTWPRRLRHVQGAVEGFEPDLVHTSLTEANIVGRLAAKRAGVPVLTSLVSTQYDPVARVDRDVAAWKLRVVQAVDAVLSRYATDRFHAITEAVADHAVRRLRVDPSRITVVPRGRSSAVLGAASPGRRARARAALGVDAAAPLLLAVGREEPPKGHRYLLEAFSRLRARHPDAVLVMAGRPGSSSPDLDRRVAGLGVEGAVRRLGVRTDIPELLCAADLFVFPSLFEGLGGAVLEAMALEVPIVSTTAPALREVLDEGRCARLVPPTDVDALTAAMADALTDTARTRVLREAARQRFEDVYRLERCIEGMLRLYADVGRRAGAHPSAPTGAAAGEVQG